jgi:5-methyltetrahydrofolate--homocysteine methyltransferase
VSCNDLPWYKAKGVARINIKMNISEILKNEVLLCDGSMGGYSLSLALKAGFTHDHDFMGHGNLPDILNVTHPELIRKIHLEYIKAGADLIQTNTFNSTSLYFRSYHRDLEEQAYLINYTAAQIAREAVDAFEDKSRPLFVIGTIGPGNFELGKTDLGTKHGFLFNTYTEQAKALTDGGVDAFLIETCTDLVQIQAAVEAVQNVCKKDGKDAPIFVSATFSEDGSTWRGNSAHDIATIVSAYDIDALGINCMPPHAMKGPLNWLAANWAKPLLCQPNADEGFVQILRSAVVEKGASIIGGCCKTTPSDIRALNAMLQDISPDKKRRPQRQKVPVRSLVEPLLG